MPARGMDTLLYTPEQAAAIDRAQLSSLGASALFELDSAISASELANTVPTSATFFSSFEPILVGCGTAGTLSGPRRLLSPSDVMKLDAALDALMFGLRPLVLHRSGLKVLEFLLQIHEIHIHRPQLLLLTVLPYHTTAIYAKLLPLARPYLPTASPYRNLPPLAASRSTLCGATTAMLGTGVSHHPIAITVMASSSAFGSKNAHEGSSASTAGRAPASLCFSVCDDLIMQARHAAARHGDATENEQRVTALDGDKPTAPRIHINKSSHSTFEAVLLIDTLPTLLASSRVETALFPIIQSSLMLLGVGMDRAYITAGIAIIVQTITRTAVSVVATNAIAERLATLVGKSPNPSLAAYPLICLHILQRRTHFQLSSATMPLLITVATTQSGTEANDSLGDSARVGKGGSRRSRDSAWRAPVLAFESLSSEYDLSLLLPSFLTSLHAHAPATESAALLIFSAPWLRSANGAATLASLLLNLPSHSSPASRSRAENGVRGWVAKLIGLNNLRESSEAAMHSLTAPLATRRVLIIADCTGTSVFPTGTDVVAPLITVLLGGTPLAAAVLTAPAFITRFSAAAAIAPPAAVALLLQLTRPQPHDSTGWRAAAVIARLRARALIALTGARADRPGTMKCTRCTDGETNELLGVPHATAPRLLIVPALLHLRMIIGTEFGSGCTCSGPGTTSGSAATDVGGGADPGDKHTLQAALASACAAIGLPLLTLSASSLTTGDSTDVATGSMDADRRNTVNALGSICSHAEAIALCTILSSCRMAPATLLTPLLLTMSAFLRTRICESNQRLPSSQRVASPSSSQRAHAPRALALALADALSNIMHVLQHCSASQVGDTSTKRSAPSGDRMAIRLIASSHEASAVIAAWWELHMHALQVIPAHSEVVACLAALLVEAPGELRDALPSLRVLCARHWRERSIDMMASLSHPHDFNQGGDVNLANGMRAASTFPKVEDSPAKLRRRVRALQLTDLLLSSQFLPTDSNGRLGTDARGFQPSVVDEKVGGDARRRALAASGLAVRLYPLLVAAACENDRLVAGCAIAALRTLHAIVPSELPSPLACDAATDDLTTTSPITDASAHQRSPSMSLRRSRRITSASAASSPRLEGQPLSHSSRQSVGRKRGSACATVAAAPEVAKAASTVAADDISMPPNTSTILVAAVVSAPRNALPVVTISVGTETLGLVRATLTALTSTVTKASMIASLATPTHFTALATHLAVHLFACLTQAKHASSIAATEAAIAAASTAASTASVFRALLHARRCQTSATSSCIIDALGCLKDLPSWLGHSTLFTMVQMKRAVVAHEALREVERELRALLIEGCRCLQSWRPALSNTVPVDGSSCEYDSRHQELLDMISACLQLPCHRPWCPVAYLRVQAAAAATLTPSLLGKLKQEGQMKAFRALAHALLLPPARVCRDCYVPSGALQWADTGLQPAVMTQSKTSAENSADAAAHCGTEPQEAAMARAAASRAMRTSAANCQLPAGVILAQLLHDRPRASPLANRDGHGELNTWVATAIITLEVLSARGPEPSYVPSLLMLLTFTSTVVIGMLALTTSSPSIDAEGRKSSPPSPKVTASTRTTPPLLVGMEISSASDAHGSSVADAAGHLLGFCELVLTITLEATATMAVFSDVAVARGHANTLEAATSAAGDALAQGCKTLVQCVGIAESEGRARMSSSALELLNLAASLLAPSSLAPLFAELLPHTLLVARSQPNAPSCKFADATSTPFPGIASTRSTSNGPHHAILSIDAIAKVLSAMLPPMARRQSPLAECLPYLTRMLLASPVERRTTLMHAIVEAIALLPVSTTAATASVVDLASSYTSLKRLAILTSVDTPSLLSFVPGSDIDKGAERGLMVWAGALGALPDAPLAATLSSLIVAAASCAVTFALSKKQSVAEAVEFAAAFCGVLPSSVLSVPPPSGWQDAWYSAHALVNAAPPTLSLAACTMLIHTAMQLATTSDRACITVAESGSSGMGCAAQSCTQAVAAAFSITAVGFVATALAVPLQDGHKDSEKRRDHADPGVQASTNTSTGPTPPEPAPIALAAALAAADAAAEPTARAAAVAAATAAAEVADANAHDNANAVRVASPVYVSVGGSLPRRTAAAAVAPVTASATAAAAACLFRSLVEVAAAAVAGVESNETTDGHHEPAQSHRLPTQLWPRVGSAAQTALHAMVDLMTTATSPSAAPGAAISASSTSFQAPPSAALLQPIGEMLTHSCIQLRTSGVALLSAQLATLLADVSLDGEGATSASSTATHLLQIVGEMTPFLVPSSATQQDIKAQGIDVAAGHVLVDAATAQAAILSVDSIARSLARSHPATFESCMPAALRALYCSTSNVVSAAALLLSTLISKLRVRLLPFLPKLVPGLLDAYSNFSCAFRPSVAGSLATTLFSTVLPSLLPVFPALIAPYLPRLLIVTLSIGMPASMSGPSAPDASSSDLARGKATPPAELVVARQGLLRGIAKAVPPRVLLNAMSEALSHLPGAAIPSLLSLLERHLTMRPSAEVAAHRALAYALLHVALSFRDVHTQPSSPSFKLTQPIDSMLASSATEHCADAVEIAGGSALEQLTSCLNEVQLRPILLRALAYASEQTDAALPASEGSGDSQNHAASKNSAEAGTGADARRAAAFFRMLEPSQRRFAALYSPYFAVALSFATATLKAFSSAHLLLPPHLLRATRMTNHDEGSGSGSRQRKLPSAAGATLDRDSTQHHCDGAANSTAARVALLSCLRFLDLGLAHHRATPAASIDALSKLQAPLSTALTAAAATGAAASALSSRPIGKHADSLRTPATHSSSQQQQRNSGCVHPSRGSAKEHITSNEKHCEIASQGAAIVAEALQAIRALAMAVGAEGLHVLHHSLCAEARGIGQASPHVHVLPPRLHACETPDQGSIVVEVAAAARYAALQGLLEVYNVLGEDALPLLAEALPVASEAMEDANANIRQAALALMRVLESISMDD